MLNKIVLDIPQSSRVMRNQLNKYKYYSKTLLLSTVVMIGLIMVFFMYHSYTQNLKNAEKQELKSLLVLTQTLALNLDGDLHKSIVCNHNSKDEIKTNTENKTYQKIHELLKKTQEVNQLKTPIYTLFKGDICPTNKNPEAPLLFGITSNEPYFRHGYEKIPDILLKEFDNGGTISKYQTENGKWLSAFYPIKNRIGETVAVVQADRMFDNFIAVANTQLLNDSIYAIVFLSLFGIAFFFVYRWILRLMDQVNVELKQTVVERTKKLNDSNLELKKLTGQLENIVTERTKELASSNEKLKAFAHVASHDLQSPLRMITSFAQLFKKKYGDVVDEDGQVYLDYITTNGTKMSGLIGDILKNSLLPSENTNDVEKVDLDKIIENVVDNLEMDISKYNAQINYNHLPTIRGFSSDFLQLFQNFISNSIKYSRHGIFPIINVESEKLEDSFLIKISDNGKGISEEALENIFKEFNRGDAKDDGGFGIGLATCKRIIKEYHGDLNVSSLVNVGTTFEFSLKDRDTAKASYEKAVDASLGVALKN